MSPVSTVHSFDCRDIGGLLSAWVDGELMPDEKADFEAHLLSCQACSLAARSHVGLKAAVRRSGPIRKAPASLRKSVTDKLEVASRETAGARALRFISAMEPRTVAIAASLVGVLTWFGMGGLRQPVIGSVSSNVVHGHALEDGVALHARTLPLDFTGSDVGAVQQWLQSKLDYGVQLPRFPARSGARTPALQGVRLSTVSARPAAVVSYTMPDEHSKVSLVIIDDPSGEPMGEARQFEGHQVWVAKNRGFNVATWKNDEVVYSLISDLDERDILDLVRTAQLH
ncbi:MAG: zf-HC2 domain-containing protein [Deltaproteobacteria bacterium]|nr:zf-HC2 domain-containing protein [Deltaproteobacteria bacterium]